jgi:hypothetical protein
LKNISIKLRTVPGGGIIGPLMSLVGAGPSSPGPAKFGLGKSPIMGRTPGGPTLGTFWFESPKGPSTNGAIIGAGA